MWRDDARLLDILLAAGDAREFVHGLDWTGFSNSKLHQSAVMHCLGDYWRGSGPSIQGIPGTPSRDPLAENHRHAPSADPCLQRVRLGVVWEAVQNDLPSLIETLKPLIPPEDNFC